MFIKLYLGAVYNYEVYSEINVQWASVVSPVKMATWRWHSTEK